jgi:hypothetical protein
VRRWSIPSAADGCAEARVEATELGVATRSRRPETNARRPTADGLSRGTDLAPLRSSDSRAAPGRPVAVPNAPRWRSRASVGRGEGCAERSMQKP